ncbi:hypothetical protein A2V49_00845 [candidate division WWE3 bacterium RBG_19FT_COMBO_34_6]|uniref:Uncharacterized protein n=1 Tax=candidate division WWE3 bacterium RBG_19FT_COMBO_34_6 TaxID=1802612 RepID=A0A1F4UKA1_UNCKA|nr:MAG: hypothetical protein A2V49_00845 [candidate division WWE3 bacterium RBG_19FT_COMBO_34_6]
MKKFILSSLLLSATILFAVTVRAANLTVANDADERDVTDTRTDFVVIDTNNPADHDGYLDKFEYYATADKPFYFLIVDEFWNVKWVSDEIDPEYIDSSNEYEPDDSVYIEEGWNVGLYYPQAGVVPFDYDTGAERAYFTNAGWGMPEEDDSLTFQDLEQGRVYSYVAHYNDDDDEDGTPDDEDCYPDDADVTVLENSKACQLYKSGVEGKGILTAPGLQKEFNLNSQAPFHAGKKPKD